MIKIQTDSNQLGRNTQRSQTKLVNPACLPVYLIFFIPSSKVQGHRYKATATEKERKKRRISYIHLDPFIRIRLGHGTRMEEALNE